MAVGFVRMEKGERMPTKSEIKGRLMIKLTDGNYVEIPEVISLEEAETMAEQYEFVRVVRCRDCEWWYPEVDDEYGHCRKHDFWTFGGWFCADGEER